MRSHKISIEPAYLILLTSDLSAEGIGFYLLLVMWRRRTGVLPNDKVFLRSITRCRDDDVSESELDYVLRTRFEDGGDGNLNEVNTLRAI